MWSKVRQLLFNNPFTMVLAQHPMLARLCLLMLAGAITAGGMSVYKPSLMVVEEQIGSLAWRLNPDAQPEERINIVAIDEKSIEQLGAWPWSRETMARLSVALGNAGVQLQLYDVVFPEGREGDDLFVSALQASPAVISQLPDLLNQQGIQTGVMTHPLSGIKCTAGTSLNSADSYVANKADYASIAKGHIAVLLDADGAARKVPALICVDGKAYPALSVSALLMGIGSQRWEASFIQPAGLMRPAQELQLTAYPGFGIPTDASGNMRVSYRKDPDAYRFFSAIDIINGTIDTEVLENTWALVGYTAFGLVDIVPTPFNAAAPGVEIQARILGSILDNNIPYTPVNTTAFMLLVSMLFAGVLLAIASKKEQAAGYALSFCVLLMPALTILLHVKMLTSANIWLGWLAPSLYSVLAAGLLVIHEYARVRLERGRVLNNLSSYLPVDVAKEIAYNLPNSSISARRQSVTLLSADLRNFSAYGESRPPEESAALLHYFFVRATEIIEAHQGQVHEFKGDALLALWQGSDEKAANHALDAAIAMQKSMHEVLPQNPPQGLEPLALGIGIEQGPVLIGSIGPAHRRTHTLLGETVTIVLRIQDMTMDLAQPVLIGECAARQLADQSLESQGSYLLSGLQTPHTLFAPAQSHRGVEKNQSDAPSLKLLHGGRQ